MMREWRRVPADTLCGNCPTVIPQDEPAIYITLAGVKRELVRCQSCVGLAPPDLPPRERSAPIQSFTKPMQPVRKTALGWTRQKTAETIAERPRYNDHDQ